MQELTAVRPKKADAEAIRYRMHQSFLHHDFQSTLIALMH
jgi:hypothetical protein